MSQLSKQHILITGAAGFVGRALTKSLLKNNHQLFLVSRKKGWSVPGAKVIVGDLNDPGFCQRAVRGIDLVYYLAGEKKNLDWHTKQPFDFMAGNVKPLLNFLAALKNSKVKTLIYLSSTIVEYIDPQAKVIDGYALGKYLNEQILKAFIGQSKIAVKVVRAAAIYGPGDNFDPKTANFIPAKIRQIAQARSELLVWGRGLRRMEFIYIDDLVANLIAISRNKSKRFITVGNKEAVAVNQTVKIISRLMGKTLLFKHDLNKPDKNTRLHRFTNLIKSKVSLRAGLEQTIDYYHKKIDV